MKRLSHALCALPVSVLFLLFSLDARADAIAISQLSFNGLSISAGGASIQFMSNWQASAYAQATVNNQYNSGTSPSAFAVGDYSLALGSASAPTIPSYNISGAVGASNTIFGQLDASDQASAQATVWNNAFIITGGSGSVSTTFTIDLGGMLGVSTDVYGQSAQAEAVFTLQLNGNPVLFNDQLISIGPSASQSQGITPSFTDTTTLQYNTVYQILAEGDTETSVLNVPEPGVAALAVGMLLVFVFWRKRARGGIFPIKAPKGVFFLAAALLILPAASSFATYIGSDPPQVCEKCGYPPNRQSVGSTLPSLTEGNVREDYPVVTLQSGSGPTLDLSLVYNSYNADGSRAQTDTGLGLGWTHTYNQFLFSQRGSYFLMGPDGRITQFHDGGPGTYVTDSGYFETLTQTGPETFAITNKAQSWWIFNTVPNNPFLVAGPIYRLTQMGDRNNNVTSFTYNNGLLTHVTDTYGRTVTFTYTNHHIATITDPLGRVTQFQYDAKFRMPIRITDPAGNTVRYTYNSLYQMTRKMDRDNRTYFYLFRNQKPWAVLDGNGQTWFAMANPNNWAVDRNALAYYLRRVYLASTTTNSDGNGNTWRYQYDTNGYITQLTAPDNAVTQYSYDPLTRQLAAVTNGNSAVTRYQYDGNGNRTNATDALGNTTTYTYEPNFNQVTSMTDSSGRVTKYEYDGRGNRIAEVDPLNETNFWTYDGHGNVTSFTDRNGYTTTYAYDAFGDRTNMTDPIGNTTSYTYDAVGNRISMTDPLYNTTLYQYDALDRVIGVTNALGGVTITTYDALGRQISVTDPNTNTTTYAYDVRGRLIHTTDPLLDSSTSAYDLNNNRVSLTDELGRTTTFAYDSQNRLIVTSNALGGTITYTYDAVGNQITSTDPNGHTTTNSYDAINRRIAVTDPLGGVTTFSYASPTGPPCCSPTLGSSLVTRMQDADGNITFFHYDELNRRVQAVRKNSDTNDVINPTDAVTTTAYDADGNIAAVINPVTNTTTYAYDPDDRRISIIDAAGDTTLTLYDPDGNVLITTAPNGNVTTNVYDSLNRLTAAYDQVGIVVTHAYDPDGNTTSTADGLGDITSYSYDALNRQISVTDALSVTTVTEYDAVGNVVTNIDRNGHITTYNYDALNRRVAITDALGHTNSSSYDADGNVTSITDPNGHVTTYGYDALNRQVTETYPDAAPNTRTNVYDAVGNLIERIDQKGQTTTYSYNPLYFLTNRAYSPSGSNDSFTYDDDGRMLSANRGGWVDTFAYDGADRVITADENGRVLTYNYNIPGRVQTNTYPSGRRIASTYDARDRLVSESDATVSPPIAVYTYDDANRVITRDFGNGTTATYTYNSNNWVTSLENSNLVGRIAGFGYAYDNEGNELYEQNRGVPTNSQVYTYDPDNRLTNFDVGTLVGQTIPSPALAKQWVLDPDDDWSEVISNGFPEANTFGTDDEELTDNGQTYQYDADGNLVQNPLYQYSYDEENRLVQVERRSDSAIVGRYFYDALGRRINEITDASGSPATTEFIYDGSRIIENLDGLGTTIATYTYGNYVDEVLTMNRGGETYYYHPNSLWSVEALSDSSGNVAERYTYDAYGSVTVYDGSYNPIPLNTWGTPHSVVTNDFLFTGRELGEEDALYFYRARYYDSLNGRFIERDPAAYDELNLNTAELSPYSYASGEPTRFLDPFGLRSITIVTDGAGDTSRVYSEFIKDFTGNSTTTHRNLSTLDQVVDAILSYKEGEITRLNFGGHGAGCGCAFQSFADRANVNGRGFATLPKDKIDAIKKRLAPNAQIWVFGCMAAGDSKDGKDLAKLLNRPVYAQTGTVTINYWASGFNLYLSYQGYAFGGDWIRFDPNGDMTNVTQDKKVSAEDLAKLVEKEQKKCGCKAK